MEPFAHDAELAAIRERMMQPTSREQQVAAELWGYLTTVGPATGQDFVAWKDSDWLRFDAHMIKTVEHVRDLLGEDVATAMSSPPRFPVADI
jgi:hypothetical protein